MKGVIWLAGLGNELQNRGKRDTAGGRGRPTFRGVRKVGTTNLDSFSTAASPKTRGEMGHPATLLERTRGEYS